MLSSMDIQVDTYHRMDCFVIVRVLYCRSRTDALGALTAALKILYEL